MIRLPKWLLVAATVGGLSGCSTADLNEFSDALYCINAYPDDEYAQNQCANEKAAYREADQRKSVIVWCNDHVIAPYNEALDYLRQTVPSFLERYRENERRLHRYAGYYSEHCITEWQQRANPEDCGMDRLLSEQETIKGLQQELGQILGYDARASNAAQTFNQECSGYADGKRIDFESEAERFAHHQNGLSRWSMTLSDTIEERR